MVQSDALSRRPDHDPGDSDNKDMVLLPSELFAKAVNIELIERIRDAKVRDLVVVETIQALNNGKIPPLKSAVKDWKIEGDLILYKDKVYIPCDQDLRREIVRQHHDLSVMGHPGVQKTYALVAREYYWPQMRDFITKYVQGCAECQASKVNTHPTSPPLQPIPAAPDARPFSTLTMDFITDLPESEGFDSLLVVVDHDVTKGIVLTPCNKTIDVVVTADLLHRNVYRRYGLPDRIISDRGPQFAAKVFQEWNTMIGVKSSMSTAYHPQTDGESERVNQEVEVSLRILCGNHPETWVKLLPEIEFTHNQHPHSVTNESPFRILMGYEPKAVGTPRIESKFPAVKERLDALTELRKEAAAAHEVAAAAMAKRIRGKLPDFKEGDKVWLEGKNLRLNYPHRKLAPKREGPFKIIKVLGPVTYRLQLPKTWKMHPVFHATLLTPFRTTEEHGPSYPRPPPDLVEQEPEYEVEAITNHRLRYHRRQYLIAWKGYPASENTWEPESALKNAQTILANYKKRHKL